VGGRFEPQGWAWRRNQELCDAVCTSAASAAAGLAAENAAELLGMLVASLTARLASPQAPLLAPGPAAAAVLALPEGAGLPERVAAASLGAYRLRCAEHAAAWQVAPGRSALSREPLRKEKRFAGQ
jgi:hypothetical protein